MEPHNRHVQEQIHSTSNRQLAYGREHWSSPKDTTCSKSWAQQTEESYQLQLALALRLSSDSSSAADPYFLDSATGDRPIGSARDLSHRFWVNGCLSYIDRVPDGFYLIHGMDPYVWTISTDLKETGRIPSFESLKAVDPRDDFSIEVVLVDKHRDPSLKELQNRALSHSSSWIKAKQVVDELANLVCNHMGGAASSGEDGFANHWKEFSGMLKNSLGSVVLPIGSLSVGLCVHRALLFKVLADVVNLPCRIAKGCKYCRSNVASSCLVRFGPEREYLVDLMCNPGALCSPDSLLNGTSSILVSSPLCHPRFKLVETAEDFRILARLYFFDCQSLNIAFDDPSSGAAVGQDDNSDSRFPKPFDRSYTESKNLVSTSNNHHELFLPQRTARLVSHDRDPQMQNSFNPLPNVINSKHLVKGAVRPSHILPMGNRDVQPILPFPRPRPGTNKNLGFMEKNHSVTSRSSLKYSLVEEDLEIPWSELVLKENIGAGSFGTVHRAKWRDSDVAVKILMEQDFHAERFEEFLREVAIMKRLRHPNIVLFMGAVTQPPHLSIVTEYLSRGSLYKLLRMPDAGIVLDERRRLNMAYDVAMGMNYLHQLKPPIVHRDLKSPNLLVDGNYTVKVCDFGLSRSKANTFLSSKTAAGTPEWMAPEVLRDEPSNEKSDVYSFGVILWELVTLQRPWKHLNPAQVVAAVAFKGKRLEIPAEVNHQVAYLIEACWANDPSKRPPFSFIKEYLQPLISSSPQPFQGSHSRNYPKGG